MRFATLGRGWPFIFGLLFLIATACGGGGKESSNGPPWGLDTIVLPADTASVVAVLEALPPELGGKARSFSADTPISDVSYGEALLRVQTLDAWRAFAEDPDLTAADVLTLLVESGEVNVGVQQLDPEGTFVYLVGTDTGNDRLFYFAAWAAPDGAWLFNARADAAETRAELVAAFVEAVQAISS